MYRKSQPIAKQHGWMAIHPTSQEEANSSFEFKMTRSHRHRGSAERSQPESDKVANVLRENQKLITLGRLAASIAHEINNPLESITNLLYLIEQDEPEKTQQYLDLAQRELARVVQITRQTLTFSRETSAPMRVELSELIEEVLGLYARRIGDKAIHIARQYESREQVLVLPGEMRQVLSNLISNAIEASGLRSRIVIRIHEARYWASRGSQRGLRLSIGDNGSGIQREVRSRLGQPFFTTKGQSGTGLGLWVTQSILSHYGSNLQVRSSVGRAKHGTVFSFVLPLNLRPIELVQGSGSGGGPEDGPGNGLSRQPVGRLRLVGSEAEPSRRNKKGTPARSADDADQPLWLRACGD